MPHWSDESYVFDGLELKGCLFHWTQAVWRKVQELGLQVAYTKDNDTFAYVRKLMALPFLPAHDITVAFYGLKAKAATEPIPHLVCYIEQTWIKSVTW